MFGLKIKNVPITPDIMVRNGFEPGIYSILKLGEDEWIEYYHHEHRLTRWTNFIDEWNNHSRSMKIVFRCHVYDTHDLQAAFDLMHLDKTVRL